MLENSDNKDFEHMTNNSDQEDIDIIFNEDDRVKIITPSKDELKDFPEKREDDYISDDDLDFVDSFESFEKKTDDLVLSFGGSDDDQNIVEIVESPEESEESEIAIDHLSHVDNIKIDLDHNSDLASDKLKLSDEAGLFFSEPSMETENFDEPQIIESPIPDEIAYTENQALGIPDIPEFNKKNEPDLVINPDDHEDNEPDLVINADEHEDNKPDLVINTDDDVEESDLVFIDNEEKTPDLVINSNEEPENSSAPVADDADRIEIEVKDFEQEVILPEVSETPEITFEEPSQLSSEKTIQEEKEPELVINPAAADEFEIKSEDNTEVKDEIKEETPELVFNDGVNEELTETLNAQVPEELSVAAFDEVKEETPEIRIEENKDETAEKTSEVVFVDEVKEELPETVTEPVIEETKEEVKEVVKEDETVEETKEEVPSADEPSEAPIVISDENT